jgi:hypothetical protein
MSYYLIIMIITGILSFYLAIRNEKKFQNELNKLEEFKKDIETISSRLEKINNNEKTDKVQFDSHDLMYDAYRDSHLFKSFIPTNYVAREVLNKSTVIKVRQTSKERNKKITTRPGFAEVLNQRFLRNDSKLIAASMRYGKEEYANELAIYAINDEQIKHSSAA